MEVNDRKSIGLYILTIMIAMVLRIAPWPYFIQIINPDWVLLVLIYWCLAMPERVGIFNAWFIGLFTDVLTGRMLGQNALIYSLASFVFLKMHKRIRRFHPVQQSLFVFCTLLISHLSSYLIENIQHPTQFHIAFWFPVITGTGCWPFIHFLLEKISNPGNRR